MGLPVRSSSIPTRICTINSIIAVFLLMPSVKCTYDLKNVTIFAALRSISNSDPTYNQIQMNSIWSWSQLVPMGNILLFFDDVESCSFVQTHYPTVSCRNFPLSTCFHPVYNRSLIRCAFELAQKYTRTSILLFVNGDIMLDESILHSISFVATHLPEFFLVGCRRDYEISASINASNPEKILEDAAINNKLHSTTGVDLIAFKTNVRIRMPPFIIGVYRWDNWLLSEILLRTNITLIDVTQSVLAIHQQPKQLDGVEPIPHSSRPGALYNDALTKNASGVDYKVGFIHNAHRVLVGNCQKDKCLLKDNLNRTEQILIMQRANAMKYIAVLTVNTGYIMMAWNWICWAKRIGFRNYIFLAEDRKAYEVLRANNEPVYISYNQSLITSSKSEAAYGSFEFQITMSYRVEFLMRVLRAGYHFLNADMDAIWLADPFDYISHDLATAVQGQMHKETKMSGGFVVVHATPEGRKFWQSVMECQKQNLLVLRQDDFRKRKRPTSDFTEQECINNRLNTTKIRLLDPYLFPDGRSFFDQQRPQRRGIVPVVIHGNWLVGLKSKFSRLRAWNLLASTTKSCSLLKTGLSYPTSKKETTVQLRIRVLTYNRLESLQRLLKSLLAANYTGDSVALDIYIDRPSPEATFTEKNKWKKLLAYMGDNAGHSRNFRWPYGPVSITVHKKHIGLLGQWTLSTDHPEVQLFLEDDLVLSPHFYIFLKRAIDYYYHNKSNYDSRLFGLSLQHQHTVLGKTTGRRIRSIENELNTTQDSTFYKYQLLGSWGAVFFPEHWRAFLQWMATVRLDDLQAACTPNLLLTEWWITRHRSGRLWTPWFVRFVFERGWYSLYTNFPNLEAFATNYREAGLNFNTTRGPMNPLIKHLQPSVHFNFTHKPPIFDFHFIRISQPALLGIRSNLWHRNHFSNQCLIVETDDSSKKSSKSQLHVHIKTNGAVVPIKPIESKVLKAGYVQARVLDEDVLSPSTNCLKLFLLFELVSVFPVIAIVIALIFLLTRRRGVRTKGFNKINT